MKWIHNNKIYVSIVYKKGKEKLGARNAFASWALVVNGSGDYFGGGRVLPVAIHELNSTNNKHMLASYIKKERKGKKTYLGLKTRLRLEPSLSLGSTCARCTVAEKQG